MRIQYQAACRATGSLFFLLLLFGCAATPQSDRLLEQTPASLRQPFELDTVAFFPQEKYQCGPAALATVLDFQGVVADLTTLSDRVYILGRKGSLQLELLANAREYGLIPYVVEPELESMLKEVRAGHPVLVLQNLGVSWYPQWHYAVVIGYDLAQHHIILRSGTIRRYPMNLFTFEHTWRRSQRWGMILLKPGQLPVVRARDASRRYWQAVAGFEQQKNWSLIDTAYRSGLQVWPDDRNLRMGLGNNLYQQNKKPLALQQYLQVIHSSRDFAPAYNNAAQIYAELGNFKQALNYIHEAIRLGGVHGAQFTATLNEIKKLRTQRGKP